LASTRRVVHFDKRGTGMSDRFAEAPDLETQMDDVRAVMDAAGLGTGGVIWVGHRRAAPGALLCGHPPERTVAVCTDSEILYESAPGYPWGFDPEEHAAIREKMVATWGDEDHIDWYLKLGYGEAAPIHDPGFRRRNAKGSRYAATPTSYAAFDAMWSRTDIRSVLGNVQVPAAVVYKKEAEGFGCREHAAYLADRIPGARLLPVEGREVVVWVEDPEPLVGTIEAFSRRSRVSWPISTVCLQRFFSPTLWVRPTEPPPWETARGRNCWSDTIRSCGRFLPVTAAWR
jgi:pimeloyl-ACP methyl ester carboxylesterase